MGLHAFPAASHYVDSLPDGFDSFPNVVVRPEALGPLRDCLPGDVETLPGLLGAYFRGETAGEWIPEVVGQAAILVVCDVQGLDAMLSLSCAAVKGLSAGPTLRSRLCRLAPALHVARAGRRWHALRRGSSFATSRVHCGRGRIQAEFRVTAPGPVFTTQFARSMRVFLAQALQRAPGDNLRICEMDSTPAELAYSCSWDARCAGS